MDSQVRRLVAVRTIICLNISKLIEGLVLRLHTCATLNPATFLPDNEEKIEHNCQQVIAQTYATQRDLLEVPLTDPYLNLCTDGTSFVEKGLLKAGYTVVSDNGILESNPLTPGTSTQLAEAIALTQVLELGEGKRVNIYTYSKYAYLVLHAHAAIWREREFLTSEGIPVKHQEAIRRLLLAVQKLKEVAVLQCQGHQKGKEREMEGNCQADIEAKRATSQDPPLEMLIEGPLVWGNLLQETKPRYSAEEIEWETSGGHSFLPSGWLATKEGKILLSATNQWKLLKTLHQTFHLSIDSTPQMAKSLFTGPGVFKTIKQIVRVCEVCQRNNPLHYRPYISIPVSLTSLLSLSLPELKL
ncbi:LOW QUALITY PROTEIN: uncharacterized protein [Chlorocebus sabaeus]|uniref:LOW QUALITY PROTEIN: uncharacterized protein n=1 Tax=Chlorocebus sabaeus TaxID=60711 RepID=UPI003BFA2590